jgi:FdhD protein
MTRPVAIRSLTRFGHVKAPRPDQDLVAVEAPLTLLVQPPAGPAQSLGVLMRTPGADAELALGALLSEGVITRASHVRRIVHADDTLTVHVTDAADLSALAGRAGTATSACGLCGRLEVLRIDTVPGAGPLAPLLSASLLATLPLRLREVQPAFAETGGLHAAGVFTPDGTVMVAREDVGRHNAVDKVTGWLLQHDRLPAVDAVLVVSGRVAYEIVHKAARAGLRTIVAVGAPTDLAVDAARAAGITLAGFVRDNHFNVYTWPERVGGE